MRKSEKDELHRLAIDTLRKDWRGLLFSSVAALGFVFLAAYGGYKLVGA